ncbi:MAG: radical SAM protein [Crenarchaeota archaeon]|nr:radical SAM protein [Thermoproteota archaeon]
MAFKVRYLNKPFSVSIFLTKCCNLSCKHCVYGCSSDRPKIFLSLEDFKTILDKLANDGVMQIVLTGGEPLLHPNFANIVKLIHDYGLSWRLITNGTLINEDVARVIARNEPSSVIISIDGPDKATHEFIRGANTFERVINALQILKKHNVKLSINTVLHRMIDETKISAMIELAIKYNASLNVIPLYPSGNAIKNWSKISHTPLTVRKLVQFYIEESKRYGVKREEPSIGLEPDTCGAARMFMSIDEYGYTYPCDLFVETDFRGPSLLEADVDQCWNSIPFKLVRKILIDIRGCVLHNLCQKYSSEGCKPCPALAYRFFKNIFMPDPRCLLYSIEMGDTSLGP